MRNALRAVIVLLPIPLAMMVALRIGVDAVGVLGVVAGVIVASVILRRLGLGWGDLGMRRPRSPFKTFAAAIGLAIALEVLTVLLGPLVVAITHQKPDISRFDVLRGNVAALALGLTLSWTTAAFGEEMLFRGFLVSCLSGFARASRGRTVFAAVLSSLLFGAGHAYQGRTGVILTALIGLAYAVVYLRGERGHNLWVPILAHGLYDTMGMVAIFFSVDRAG
jgi:membrane protease YdiL (CAAX protease family)